MKSFLLKLITVVAAFFAPIVPLILIVGAVIAIDTFWGIKKARFLGEEVNSKKMSNIIGKMLLYNSAILTFYPIDLYILSDFTQIFTEIDFVSTKLVAITLIRIEMLSINESYQIIKGVDMIKHFKNTLKRVSEVKEETH